MSRGGIRKLERCWGLDGGESEDLYIMMLEQLVVLAMHLRSTSIRTNNIMLETLAGTEDSTENEKCSNTSSLALLQMQRDGATGKA